MRTHKISSVLDDNLCKLLSQGSNLDESGFDWTQGEFVTPYTNRGVLRTSEQFDLSLHLGWFTLSFTFPNITSLGQRFKLIKDAFCLAFKDDIIKACHPAYGYQFGIESAKGAVFYYSNDLPHFTLKLSEQFCTRFDTETLLINIKDLVDSGAKITRMDLTIDDFSKQLSVKYIHDSRFTGEMCARVSTVGYGTKHRGQKISYEKTELGSRESLIFSRIYDKARESKGRIDAIRWEMELKEILAQNLFQFIYQESFPFQHIPGKAYQFSSSGFRQAVLSILASKYDFKDYDSSNQKWRATRSPWWESFLEGVQKAKIELPKVIRSIDKTITWVSNQVGTSLNILSKHFNMEFFDFICSVIHDSEPKLKERHLVLLRE